MLPKVAKTPTWEVVMEDLPARLSGGNFPGGGVPPTGQCRRLAAAVPPPRVPGAVPVRRVAGRSGRPRLQSPPQLDAPPC